MSVSERILSQPASRAASSVPAVRRAPAVGAILGGFLLLAALALPWHGWVGLHTVGPTVGLFGVAALAMASFGWGYRSRELAVVAGFAAAALIIFELGSGPSRPIAGAAHATGSLVLGLIGAVVVVGAGALSLIREGVPERSPVLDAEQAAALRMTWQALWASRLLVWVAGVLGVLDLGRDPSITSAPPLTQPFGSLGNVLSAPATSWDATNYLQIARFGYAPGLYGRAYFPTYPVLVRLGAWSPRATLITAIAVSIVAFALALYLLHRLVSLECGERLADMTVLVVAFSPMAFFFSAAYTESTFLALSVGAFYAARRGWWVRAGVCGAFAAATRSTGVLLLVPLLVLYLYGPRTPGAFREHVEAARANASKAFGVARRFAPRYSLSRDAAFLLLVPLGALTYYAYLGVHGDALAPLHAEQMFWHRHFFPGLGAVKGVRDAFLGIRQIAAGPASHILATPSYHTAGQLSNPLKLSTVDLTDLAFFLFGSVATIGALRRLPLAYGLYALTTIVLTVSTFSNTEPLVSFPRYLVVLFPCQMWLARWAQREGRRGPVLLISAGLLALFSAQFASWRWVA